MREPPIRPEYKLLEALLALDLVVESAERSDFHGTVHMKMILREAPEILASCGFALIFGLGLLSRSRTPAPAGTLGWTSPTRTTGSWATCSST